MLHVLWVYLWACSVKSGGREHNAKAASGPFTVRVHLASAPLWIRVMLKVNYRLLPPHTFMLIPHRLFGCQICIITVYYFSITINQANHHTAWHPLASKCTKFFTFLIQWLFPHSSTINTKYTFPNGLYLLKVCNTLSPLHSQLTLTYMITVISKNTVSWKEVYTVSRKTMRAIWGTSTAQSTKSIMEPSLEKEPHSSTKILKSRCDGMDWTN